MKRLGRRYRSGRAKNHYDVIVIGSGMGGLSNAGLLSKLGKKVCLLEQHYTVGGYTHTFDREGYEWDVGLHYIGDVHKKYYFSRLVFDLITNNKLTWEPMTDVYDRVVIGEKEYQFVRGRENLSKKLKGYFPDDTKAIDRYLFLVRKVGLLTPIYLGGQGMPKSFANYFNRVRNIIFPKEMQMTTQQVLEKITSNKELIGVLTAHWSDYGVSPEESPFFMHALVANHFFDGGNFPIGGSGKIAELTIPVIESAGGDVFTYAKVKKVLIENEQAIGVQLENGDQLYADQIVSACDVRTTIETLLPVAVQQDIGYKRIDELAPSGCNFTLYLGVNGSQEELNLTNANLWIYPSANHDENIKTAEAEVQSNFDIFKLNFPMLFFSFPATKDPEWKKNNPNKMTVELVAPAAYSIVQQWSDTIWNQRGDEYEKLKNDVTTRLLQEVYKHLPQLEGRIEVIELSSPLSANWFQNNRYGETFGLEHTLERFQQNWLHPQTPIKNLFLTGQDIFVGNVTGALIGGAMTTSVMLGKRVDLLGKLLFKQLLDNHKS